MSWKRGSAVAVGLLALLTAGCGLGISANDSVVNQRVVPAGPGVTSDIADGAVVEPGTRWTFTAEPGWTIAVDGPQLGKQTPSADGSGTGVWKSRPLPPGIQVPAHVVATHAEGETREHHFNISTGTAKYQYDVEFSGLTSTRYGVGHMPTLEFSIPIPKKSRPDVINNLSASVSPKNVTVAFRWLDDQRLAYRPKKFWPGHSKITVTSDITTVPIKYNGKTYWGERNSHTWRTGKSTIITIKADRHRGEVHVNGKKVRSISTSVGKPGYTTRSGIKTITDKFTVTRMTNIGVTDDEVYDIEVPYAMRLTETGEFLHAAPWNGNIGYANTSHGCTNLYTSDAAWIFERAQWGDPVITTGTGRAMETWNGPGGMWNIPWTQWRN
ncbi:MAG: Ig-like domain-containing protein [Candidatus Nanopelagicales bacterium]|nr:Ig-like domain-containing protein [Candidatus Nanopelagicales bacterium]